MSNQCTIKEQVVTVGDRVNVHLRIQEDDKSRIQAFEGIVIAIKGRDINKTFTIRKIATNSIGVERILPVSSPFIEKIEIKAFGEAKRSKLYYLRDRIGRAALRVKEKKMTAPKASAKN